MPAAYRLATCPFTDIDLFIHSVMNLGENVANIYIYIRKKELKLVLANRFPSFGGELGEKLKKKKNVCENKSQQWSWLIDFATAVSDFGENKSMFLVGDGDFRRTVVPCSACRGRWLSFWFVLWSLPVCVFVI